MKMKKSSRLFLNFFLLYYIHFASSRLLSKSSKNVRIGLKRIRQEQLCPLEYQACYCDYTNVNNEQPNSATSSSSSSSSKTNKNPETNRVSLSSLTPSPLTSPSPPVTSNHHFSIMIDCQFYINQNTQLKSIYQHKPAIVFETPCFYT